MNKIQLVTTKAKRMHLVETHQQEDLFELSVSGRFSDEDEFTFLVVFECELKTNDCSIELEYAAIFQTDDPIDDDFRKSHFPKVNAPAIAYPFLRSFISTVTINAGLNPVIVPTVNFQELAKQNELN